MADLNEQQSAQTVKLTGSDSSGTETNYLNVDSFGAAEATIRDPSSGNAVTTTLVNSKQALDVNVVSSSPTDGFKATYSASVAGLVAGAAATDIFTLTGSASKTIRVLKIVISGTQSTSGYVNVLLVKRSSANSGGTPATATAVPHDSNNAAASATVRSYTLSPTSLGTTVGALRSDKLIMPLSTPTNAQSVGGQAILEWSFGNRPGQAVVVRGTSEVLAVNLNGATLTGSSINIDIEWTEET